MLSYELLIIASIWSIIMTITFLFFINFKHRDNLCANGKNLKCNKMCKCNNVSKGESQGSHSIFSVNPGDKEIDLTYINNSNPDGPSFLSLFCKGGGFYSNGNVTFNNKFKKQNSTVPCSGTSVICCEKSDGTCILMATESETGYYIIPFDIVTENTYNLISYFEDGLDYDNSTSYNNFININGYDTDIFINKIDQNNFKIDNSNNTILEEVNSEDTSSFNILADVLGIQHNFKQSLKNGNPGTSGCIDPSIISFNNSKCCDGSKLGWYKKTNCTPANYDDVRNMVPSIIYCGSRLRQNQISENNPGYVASNGTSAFGEFNLPRGKKAEGSDIKAYSPVPFGTSAGQKPQFMICSNNSLKNNSVTNNIQANKGVYTKHAAKGFV